MAKEISLQGWFRRFWIGLFCVVTAMFLGAHFVLMHVMSVRTEENIQKNLSIVESGLSASLSSVDGILYESLNISMDGRVPPLFATLREETDPMALAEAKSKVLACISGVRNWSEIVSFSLAYVERTDRSFWLESGDNGNYAARSQLREAVLQRIEADGLQTQGPYLVLRVPEGAYMLRVFRMDSCFLFLCVDQTEVLNRLRLAAGRDGIAFTAEEDGALIASSLPLDGPLNLQQEDGYIRIGGSRYLLTSCASQDSGYRFGVLTPRKSILAELWVLRAVSLLVLLLIIGVIPVLFHWAMRNVGRPINEVAETMERISRGDMDATIPEDFRIRELQQLSGAFRHMMGQIEQLKIEKYEGKLTAQKATLQYLQLQIRPHFYANMFNIIYSMAQRKDFDMIQRVSKSIVEYSRYMFRDASEVVELRRELGHVRNYMEIQTIRYMDRCVCEMDVPERLLSALVPPFIIQSFVENSVKYAVAAEETCRIFVRVALEAESDRLVIEIRDNGAGYDEDLLNSDWMHLSASGHVGLENVCTRLKLIYGDKASIQIGNDNGAVTTIRVPYISADGIEPETEED